MFDDIQRKFSKTKKFLDDEKLYSFYELVSNEIQSGIKDEGVWAKAFSEAAGDEQKAKAKYIELRVERLVNTHTAALKLKEQEELEKIRQSDFQKQAKIEQQKAKQKAKTESKQESKKESRANRKICQDSSHLSLPRSRLRMLRLHL